MTSELSIDMNIHIYGAYCHGYQIVYKTLEFDIVCETGLHPNLLTDWNEALVGNKSMYNSANYHKSSSLSSK